MSVKDLEYILNWNVGVEKSGPQLSLDLPSLAPDELAVMTVLQEKNTPMMIDELSEKTGMGHGMLASVLLTLEFRNMVISLPGKMYKSR